MVLNLARKISCHTGMPEMRVAPSDIDKVHPLEIKEGKIPVQYGASLRVAGTGFSRWDLCE